MIVFHCVKSVQIQSFSGPYIPAFGLNAEIYGVNLRIQSKYGKIQTRKNSVFGYFSDSRLTMKYDGNSNNIILWIKYTDLPKKRVFLLILSERF